jgi:hypothetical protein
MSQELQFITGSADGGAGYERLYYADMTALLPVFSADWARKMALTERFPV